MRIPTKPIQEYPWILRLFFKHQVKKYGAVLEPAKIWGRVPKLFIAVASLYGVIDRKKNPINPVLRSLITVRVSQINWCAFCVDINSDTLIKRSGSEAKVNALENWQHSELFSEEEKAALSYTESVTRSDQNPSEVHFEQLKKYFSEDEIVELTALIAFQNMSSKFNSALDVPAQGFCKLKA
ncbi:carboxymuconolactone decarboxylase family protein [Francisellaceae bacterium]|nr:carboxymuconolactone decarboxylase family protein [Francisellaceae bacterium]